MASRDSAREARLAKALRENLKRRKEAARTRTGADAAADVKKRGNRPNTAQKPD